MRQITISLTVIIFLSSCVSMLDDPRDQDRFTLPETEYTRDEAVYMQRAYLGSRLLEPGARRKVIEYWRGQELPFKLGNTSDTMISSAAGDALSGQVNSNLGAVFSLGTAIFSSDGSSELTSGMFLPDEVNGELTDTLERANLMAVKLLQQSVSKVHEIKGYTGKCISRCNSYNETHLFIRNNDPVDGDYLYVPESFAISFMLYSFEDAKDTAGLDSRAVGFPVKWKLRRGATMIHIIDNFELTNAGSIKTNGVTEPNKMLRPLGSRDIEDTKFGRHLLRVLFSNPYMYQGSQERGYLAYNKDLFSTFTNSTPSAFSAKMID